MDEKSIKQAKALLKNTMNCPFIGDVIDELDVAVLPFIGISPLDCIKQLRQEHA